MPCTTDKERTKLPSPMKPHYDPKPLGLDK